MSSNDILQVPVAATCVKDNLSFTPAYLQFFNGLYLSMGKTTGTARFSEDSIISKLDSRNIGVQTNNNLYFNQIQFPTSVGESNIANILVGSGTNQVIFQDPALTNFGYAVGMIKFTLKTTADPGWIMYQEGSIGSASSLGTLLADDSAINLFEFYWNNVSDTYAPVSGGRSGSALADFNLNKTLTLPISYGRAILCAGSGSGLTTRTLGSTGGTESEALTVSKVASHSHTIGYYASYPPNSGLAYPAYTQFADVQNTIASTINISANNTAIYDATGSTSHSNTTGDAHNNIQPVVFLNAMVKL